MKIQMNDEIKACPICGETNRLVSPQCKNCRAGRYCDSCKRKHSILADFCKECKTAEGIPSEEASLDTFDAVSNQKDVLPAIPSSHQKSRWRYVVAFSAVGLLLVFGSFFVTNTNGRVSVLDKGGHIIKGGNVNREGLDTVTVKASARPAAQPVQENGAVGRNLAEGSSGGPKMPYEDIGACPFEGCTYRCWTVNKDTILRVDKSEKSQAVITVKKGEQVVGVTGTVVTVKAGRARVLKKMDLAGAGAQAGQTIYLLTYLGEGYYKAWYGGKIIDGADINEFKLLEKPRYTWWVLIQEKNGQSGWTRQAENFDHKDRFE